MQTFLCPYFIQVLDHLIKKTIKGKTNKEYVSEKGHLFKIRPDKLELLFPPSVKYSLR
jgi:hypothetical protein